MVFIVVDVGSRMLVLFFGSKDVGDVGEVGRWLSGCLRKGWGLFGYCYWFC